MSGAAPKTASDKKIVIITGCGRSGSTILGICLGAGQSITNLGEVSSFEILEGRPNGAAEDSDSFRFWSLVLERLRNKVTLHPGYFKWSLSQRRIYDYHMGFFPLWLGFFDHPPSGIYNYRAHLSKLYASIMSEATTDVLCDTTKRPSRILNMIAIHGAENVYAIHLKRDPIAVAQAFSKGVQSNRKGFWQTMLYYFFVNTCAALAVRRLPANHRISLWYESFIAQPDETLAMISDRLDTNLADVRHLVSCKKPLESKYIFNGNRMRNDPEIILRQQSIEHRHTRWRDRVVSYVARVLFS